MLTHRRRFRPTLLAATAALLACGVLAACGSDSGSKAKAAGAPASPGPVSTAIPPGTTLRIGDQLNTLSGVLKASGQDQGLPYEVEYSAFLGGPPMLQAFQAGSLDAGYIAPTPLIFAQAARQDIVGVAAWAPAKSSIGLVTAPGKDLSGWSDLKGKKVAVQQGTVLQSALLEGLDSVGLKYSDVTPVNLVTTDIGSALSRGSVDAAIYAQPLIAAYLATNPTAKQVAVAEPITDRTNVLISTSKALGDEAKEAALVDYTQRLQKAYQWVNTHRTAWAQIVYVDQYKLPLALGERILAEGGDYAFLQLPGELGVAQQKLADLYAEVGQIPNKLDTASEYDPRFNNHLKEP